MNKWQFKTSKTNKIASNIGSKEIKMRNLRNPFHTLTNQINNLTQN